MTLATGFQLGPYEILSPLGAGGMGEVYRARDTRLNREVAIKVLPESVATDEERLRRFAQEAKAASALNHPNIITIHEIGAERGTHYIATEFIDGQTLRAQLKMGGLPLAEALDVALQIASALSAAHEAGIVHRDIKPENVMVRRDGIVKVLDFGLAKLTERQTLGAVDTQAATLAKITTAPGAVVGTPQYMSPEQARGQRVDARTDIFSLGLVLYEMLAGRAPFAGVNVLEVIGAILNQEPAPLKQFTAEAPAELQRIVSQTLRKERKQRYQTSKDLFNDLKDLRDELSFTARLERASQPEPAAGATVQAAALSTAAAPATATNSSTRIILTELKRHKFGVALTLTLLLLAMVGGYIAYSLRIQAGPIDSIAVLPFADQNHDPELEYRSDGLTESTINSLTQLPQVRVIARNSVFRYKGKETDPVTAGKEMGVRVVLTGRLLQRGENLSVSVELTDVRENRQLWGEQYEGKAADLLAVQREIAGDIAANLRLKLSGADQRRVSKQYTENAEAYQLYMKGRFYWNKRTGETLKKAIEYFNQAIEQDPRYALAYAGLADAYMVLHFHAGVAPKESYGKAKSAALQALVLDDTLAEAHTALAYVLFRYDWKPAEAFREFQRAIELNPNYPTAYHWYGESLTLAGRFDEGAAKLRRAQALDPLSLVINTDLGNAYYYSRRYDAAIEQLHKTLELDQRFAYAHFNLGLAYTMKSQYSEALAEYRLTQQLNDGPHLLANLAYVYAASGQRAEALRLLKQLQEIAKQRYVSAYSFAVAYAGLGERGQALQWLERSYQDHSSDMTYVKTEPRFDNLHADLRFTDLVRRVGLLE